MSGTPYTALQDREEAARRVLLRRIKDLELLAREAITAVNEQHRPRIEEIRATSTAVADLTDIWRANHHALNSRRPAKERTA